MGYAWPVYWAVTDPDKKVAWGVGATEAEAREDAAKWTTAEVLATGAAVKITGPSYRAVLAGDPEDIRFHPDTEEWQVQFKERAVRAGATRSEKKARAWRRNVRKGIALGKRKTRWRNVRERAIEQLGEVRRGDVPAADRVILAMLQQMGPTEFAVVAQAWEIARGDRSGFHMEQPPEGTGEPSGTKERLCNECGRITLFEGIRAKEYGECASCGHAMQIKSMHKAPRKNPPPKS